MKKFIHFDVNDNLHKLLYVLVILFSIIIIPIFIVLLVPSFNFGGSRYGAIITHLNENYRMAEIGWISFLLFIIIMIYLTTTQVDNMYTKLGMISIFFLLIYIFAFPVITVINIILELSIDNPPYINDINSAFPVGNNLEKSYNIIKNEYLEYDKLYKADCIRKNNPGLGAIEKSKKDDNCWRAIYLKKAGVLFDDMRVHFPNTM